LSVPKLTRNGNPVEGRVILNSLNRRQECVISDAVLHGRKFYDKTQKKQNVFGEQEFEKHETYTRTEKAEKGGKKFTLK
jgi:hypothetical protein